MINLGKYDIIIQRKEFDNVYTVKELFGLIEKNKEECMNIERITNVLIDVLNEYFRTQEIKVKTTKETALFGKESVLDSMGLVNIIIDVESRFLDEDIEISLTSEKAMSRRNSPFRTISTLAEFIKEQIEGNDE